MKLISSIALLIFVVTSSFSQVTFTKDVASIIYNHCTTCHRTGEIGPFELESYDDVRNRGQIIKAVTSSRYMPPWKPDPSFSHVLDENYLTDSEINTIANWVDNGMEYGDATEEPPLPVFPDGSLLGEPDLVLEFEQTHIHKGNGQDEYRYFVLPTNFSEDKVIKAIEMRPGNRKIVHHALLFQDTEGRAAAADATTPEYGFEGLSQFNTDEVLNYDNYPGYVPGTKPLFYPTGVGQVLKAGADLVVQVHYAPWPVDEEDKSKFNIFLADEDEVIERLVDDEVMLPFNLDGGFFSFILPANQERTFHGTLNFNEDRSLIGLSPHMHYLGKEWEIWLEKPDGSRENLIKIPDWDFNWQGYYYFPQLIIAKAGSTLHATAKYDNTSNNPANPSNPPKFVTWGEGTTDEMYFLPVLSIPYQQGDEEVIFTNTSELLADRDIAQINKITPNPVKDGNIAVDFKTIQGEALQISVIDIQGKVIKVIRQAEFYAKGSHRLFVNTDQLVNGQYYINIKGKSVNMTQSFSKL